MADIPALLSPSDIFKSCPNIGKFFAKLFSILQKLDLSTCNKIPELMDGFIGGRHIFNILHVKWSNFCNFAYNLTKFLSMLGHDLEISYTKFHENQLIIDGEIDEKHALKIIVS